jgi:adenine-specific DNA-methyltransferase
MPDRPQPYRGTLELTWTNKHLRLLAEEDGSYQWVPPSDYRVAEVRLLEDAGTVGKTRAQRDRAKDNLLIRGDALNALTSLGELPEFAKELVGKVRLAYIDPPFNTKQSFLHYDDNLEHSVWLTMMRDRLTQIKQMLASDGSIWVHCDDSEHAYLKVMMDELFGRESFVANIIWQKLPTRENRTDVSTVHDYIVIYARDKSAWAQNRNLLPFGDKQTERFQNPDDDPRGPWASLPAHGKAGKGRRAAQYYTVTLPSGLEVDPPPGRCWIYVAERFQEMVRDNRVWFGRDGNGVPRLKVFLSEVEQGLVPTSLWLKDEVGSTADAKREIVALSPAIEPFATPKPERLIQRIIQIATDPGDIVLDCFLGSGTTAAVAHKMGRNWIGIERSVDTFDNYLIPRLTKVVNGEDPGGITEPAEWAGGGGFRVLDVAPSMFDEDEGIVYLAAWATSSSLAEVCAAQMHYDFEPELPFAGRRGRTRLAVIDGLVNEDVIHLLVANLPDDERLVVCGTAVDPAARTLLRELRHGSSVRKIPASILRDYRQSQWSLPATDTAPDTNGSVPTTDNAPETPIEAT